MNQSIFVSCPKGLEYMLEQELKDLNLHIDRISPQGVYGQASLSVIYDICLWSRLANRVQLILFSGEVINEAAFNKLCKSFHWQTVFNVDKTIAVEFHGESSFIRNTMYGAQLVKDGIVDHFKQLNQQRPTVDKHHPDIKIHAYLKNHELTVSLDLTGYSLHQRGYRDKQGAAPLKENLAAAMLIRSNWPELARQGYDLYDPFCGSGTLVIEAAMMAANIAPGLLRHDQALTHWNQHQPALWAKIRAEALTKVIPVQLKLYGSDEDAALVAIAHQNAKNAGVSQLVSFDVKPLAAIHAPSSKGLVIANPPYGERLGEQTALISLYQQFGQVLFNAFQGWSAAFITSSTMLARATGLRAHQQYSLYNGALPCKLYCLHLNEHNHFKANQGATLSNAAQMLANRLKKNDAHLAKWAKKNQVHAYRIYDADLPEYNFAIDRYNDYLVLYEYKAPASIAENKAEQHRLEMIQAVLAALDVPPSKLVIKTREPQKGKQQYEKMAQKNQRMEVMEGKAKIYVNLYDYLDTGLFLDHRPMRLRLGQLKKGSRLLNLFCYTAVASLHAAIAGVRTVNVDMSKTYLRWAEDNFSLNHIPLGQHAFIQEDCLQWMRQCKDRFDVIFLDPPSFSNSKRMTGTFDIQRDHPYLIKQALSLLNTDGVLYFSGNLRKFKLDDDIKTHYQVKDISHTTIDEDFKRRPDIHFCYEIRLNAD